VRIIGLLRPAGRYCVRGRRRPAGRASHEGGDLALGCGHEGLGGHGHEDAIISGGVIAEGLAKFLRHEAGVAGSGEQVLEAGEQFLAGGRLGGQACSDAHPPAALGTTHTQLAAVRGRHAQF